MHQALKIYIFKCAISMVVTCHINIKTISQKHAILHQLIMKLQNHKTQNYLNSNLSIDIDLFLFVRGFFCSAQSFHKVVAEQRFFSSSPLKSNPS